MNRKNRETYVFHSLDSGRHSELNSLYEVFSSVLVKDDLEIPMGEGNKEYTFDIELIDNGIELKRSNEPIL